MGPKADCLLPVPHDEKLPLTWLSSQTGGPTRLPVHRFKRWSPCRWLIYCS